MDKQRLQELAGMQVNEAIRDAVQELAIDHIKMAKENLDDDDKEYNNSDVLQIAKDNLQSTMDEVIDTMEVILKNK